MTGAGLLHLLGAEMAPEVDWLWNLLFGLYMINL